MKRKRNRRGNPEKTGLLRLCCATLAVSRNDVFAKDDYMSILNCSLCDEVKKENNPYVIAEFPHSLWVFGKSQFYSGYSLLLLKEHARELHDLSASLQAALFQELMLAGQAIAEVFKPWKMNYASYGNQVEHIHWHLIPRYTTDPYHLECPFNAENAKNFSAHPTEVAFLQEKKQQLRELVTDLSSQTLSLRDIDAQSA